MRLKPVTVGLAADSRDPLLLRFKCSLVPSGYPGAARRERQYNRTLFSQFPLFYRNAFPSPKGEPVSGSEQVSGSGLRYCDLMNHTMSNLTPRIRHTPSMSTASTSINAENAAISCPPPRDKPRSNVVSKKEESSSLKTSSKHTGHPQILRNSRISYPSRFWS